MKIIKEKSESKMKIKKGDTVLVVTGKDNAKTGKIVSVDPKNNKAIVDGINIYKKHVKPNKKYPQGGIIDKSVPIRISNLMVICPNCKKATRIGKKNIGREKRRVCLKCKEVVDAS
jgi:large subunit ribosomal protein L24